jgi:hypothetical protein
MKTFITARRHNGTMKTFITARRHKFPQNPKPDPLGSHVSSFLGRKAHNGTMKTFITARRTMAK